MKRKPLTENDICHNETKKGHRRCALGWCDYFAPEWTSKNDELQMAIMDEINKNTIPDWNDNTPRKAVAEVLNKVFRKFGYIR